jgi:hypothetical protein
MSTSLIRTQCTRILYQHNAVLSEVVVFSRHADFRSVRHIEVTYSFHGNMAPAIRTKRKVLHTVPFVSLYIMCPSGSHTLTIGTIQRRLAWPLHKDDTLSRSGRSTDLNIYFIFACCLRGSILFTVFCSSKLQCLLDSILGMLLICAVTPETSQTGRQNANRNCCLRSRRVTWIFQLYPHFRSPV